MEEQQRRQHRIGVALEVHIRGRDHQKLSFEEATQSNDVSRGGCSFYSTHEIELGSELEIEIVRYITGSASAFSTRGLVLRTAAEAPGRHFVAVRFIGPQFPTYSRESTI